MHKTGLGTHTGPPGWIPSAGADKLPLRESARNDVQLSNRKHRLPLWNELHLERAYYRKGKCSMTPHKKKWYEQAKRYAQAYRTCRLAKMSPQEAAVMAAQIAKWESK
jgi:hypothetical protein